MLLRFLTLVVLGIWLSGSGPLFADSKHAVLIVDVLGWQSSENPRILKVEVETGKVLAETEVGWDPDLGLSPKGDLVAVLTHNIVGGAALAHSRLEIFRTSDLKRLQNGVLPFPGRATYMDPASQGSVVFTPDTQEIIVQQMRQFLNEEKPVRRPVDNLLWSFVKREVDEEGFFKSARKDVEIPRCGVPGFLRVRDWPRVQFWNGHVNIVEAVDASSGKILSRLPLAYDDDPVLRLYDPTVLEQPEIGNLYFRLAPNGGVIFGGRYGYYLSEARPTRNVEAGFIQKIDLSANPPKVIRKGKKREPGLYAGLAAATDAGGAIFVVTKPKDGAKEETSRRIRIYNSVDLEFLNEIELSLSEINRLKASPDGKYIYALHRAAAKLAVIDVSTGREVKVLKVGQYPWLVVPLPETSAEK